MFIAIQFSEANEIEIQVWTGENNLWSLKESGAKKKTKLSNKFELFASHQKDHVLHNENMVLLYRVKQWIALNALSDWVLKLRISFAIYIRTMCAGLTPVIFAGINELKLSFCAVLSHCFSVLKQLFKFVLLENFITE